MRVLLSRVTHAIPTARTLLAHRCQQANRQTTFCKEHTDTPTRSNQRKRSLTNYTNPQNHPQYLPGTWYNTVFILCFVLLIQQVQIAALFWVRLILSVRKRKRFHKAFFPAAIRPPTHLPRRFVMVLIPVCAPAQCRRLLSAADLRAPSSLSPYPTHPTDRTYKGAAACVLLGYPIRRTTKTEELCCRERRAAPGGTAQLFRRRTKTRKQKDPTL